MLDSIRSLTLRQDQYAQVRGQIATSVIALYKAFGGGWKIDYASDPLIPAIMIRDMEERTDWDGFFRPKERPDG